MKSFDPMGSFFIILIILFAAPTHDGASIADGIVHFLFTYH